MGGVAQTHEALIINLKNHEDLKDLMDGLRRAQRRGLKWFKEARIQLTVAVWHV